MAVEQKRKKSSEMMLRRHSTLREAAGLICGECAKGDKALRTKFGAWIHVMLGFDDRTEDCSAASIQERIYQETH